MNEPVAFFNTNLKNRKVLINQATLIKTEGDISIWCVKYSNIVKFGRARRPIAALGKTREGIMVECNGVYGLGKNVRTAKKNFMRKLLG